MKKRTENIVQVEVDDPIEERRDGNGDFRASLNETERALLLEKQKLNQALAMFIDKGMIIPDIAKELGFTIGGHEGLGAKAISHQFPEFRRAMAEKASRMFLDLEANHERADIASALGLSREQLRHFTKTDEFKEAYRQLYSEITSDPILKAIEIGMVETLLPNAYHVLQELMRDEHSDSVRLKAALSVITLGGIKPIEGHESDRAELARFLKAQGVTVNVNNMNVGLPIPDAYKKAVEATLPPDVIEGVAKDISGDVSP